MVSVSYLYGVSRLFMARGFLHEYNERLCDSVRTRRIHLVFIEHRFGTDLARAEIVKARSVEPGVR